MHSGRSGIGEFGRPRKSHKLEIIGSNPIPATKSAQMSVVVAPDSRLIRDADLIVPQCLPRLLRLLLHIACPKATGRLLGINRFDTRRASGEWYGFGGIRP